MLRVETIDRKRRVCAVVQYHDRACDFVDSLEKRGRKVRMVDEGYPRKNADGNPVFENTVIYQSPEF